MRSLSSSMSVHVFADGVIDPLPGDGSRCHVDDVAHENHLAIRIQVLLPRRALEAVGQRVDFGAGGRKPVNQDREIGLGLRHAGLLPADWPLRSVVSPPIGADIWRSICGPGFGGLPAAMPSSTLAKVSGVRSS